MFIEIKYLEYGSIGGIEGWVYMLFGGYIVMYGWGGVL